MSTELKEQVELKVAELIKSGKITDDTPAEYISKRSAEIKKKMPRINEFGILSEIAKMIGLVINELDDETGLPPLTEVKIDELHRLVDTHDAGAIAVKGKVVSARVDIIPKKKDDQFIEGEFWHIANVELGDETGIVVFKIFHNPNMAEFFEDIESGSIVGKVLHLMNVSVSRSKYSGYPIELSLKRGGGFEFTNDRIDASNAKVSTTMVNSAVDGDLHFFLLSIIKKEVKTKRDGHQFVKLLCKDGNNTLVDVPLWFDESTSIAMDVKDTILVEGKIKSRDYEGKTFKSVDVNHAKQLQVNPDGYELTVRGQTVEQKQLVDVVIGDNIETTVFIKKFFTGSKPYYKACPIIVNNETGKACGKGVKLNEDGTWKCNGDHVLSEEEVLQSQNVVIINGQVTDGITLPFKIFDRGEEQRRDGTVKTSVVKEITGKTIDEFVNEYEELGDELFFQRLEQDVLSRPFKIRARVVLDDYRGAVALQLNGAEPIDPSTETETIKEKIKTVV